MKKYALSLTSGFNSSHILKFRILMIYQQNSPKIALTKFLLAIPVVALCILVSALAQRNAVIPQATSAPLPYPTPATFSAVVSVMLEANTAKKLRYDFTNDKEYMFVFLDVKTQKPVSPPEDFRILDLESKEMKGAMFAKNLHYLFKDNGTHTIELTNKSNLPILLKIYARPKKVLEKENAERKLYTPNRFYSPLVIPDPTREGC